MSNNNNNNKRASNDSRPNYFARDPHQITIIGGKHLLEGDEAADCDTVDDPDTSDLFDPRITLPLDPQTLEFTRRYGIVEAVSLKKIVTGAEDEDAEALFACVDGRQRVRYARVVNAERRREGRADLLKVSYSLVHEKRGGSAGALALMGGLNAHRTAERPLDLLAKIRAYYARTSDIEGTAIVHKVSARHVKDLLNLEATACAALLRAIERGEISLYGALPIARLVGATAQQQALAKARGNSAPAASAEPAAAGGKRRPRVSARAASVAARIARGDLKHVPVPARDLSAFIDHVSGLVEVAAENAEATRTDVEERAGDAYSGYLLGYEDALRAVQGTCETSAGRAILEEFRAAAAAEEGAAAATDESSSDEEVDA